MYCSKTTFQTYLKKSLFSLTGQKRTTAKGSWYWKGWKTIHMRFTVYGWKDFTIGVCNDYMRTDERKSPALLPLVSFNTCYILQQTDFIPKTAVVVLYMNDKPWPADGLLALWLSSEDFNPVEVLGFALCVGIQLLIPSCNFQIAI